MYIISNFITLRLLKSSDFTKITKLEEEFGFLAFLRNDTLCSPNVCSKVVNKFDLG